MKIKTDFVTNSSSTCYIAFVPDGFKVTIEMLKEHDTDGDFDEIAEEDWPQLLDEVNGSLKDLSDGKSLWREELESFWTMISILEAKECIITSVESGGGDGADTICGIKKDKIMKIFTNHILPLEDVASAMMTKGECSENKN